MGTFRAFVSICFLFGAACVLAGCFNSNPADIIAFTKPYRAEVTEPNYVLRPPDVVEVFASKVPEINQQTQQIRPDGKISFEGIGDVNVTGKTPEQAAKLIRDKAIALYNLGNDHPVDVRITVYKSNVFFVMGQVEFPGAKANSGRETVSVALAVAQPTVLAWKQRVQIVRPARLPGQAPWIYEVDYFKMFKDGDFSKDVLLQENDVVYVPPTVLAWIGMKVEELVRPIARAFSTVNTVNGGSVGPSR